MPKLELFGLSYFNYIEKKLKKDKEVEDIRWSYISRCLCHKIPKPTLQEFTDAIRSPKEAIKFREKYKHDTMKGDEIVEELVSELKNMDRGK